MIKLGFIALWLFPYALAAAAEDPAVQAPSNEHVSFEVAVQRAIAHNPSVAEAREQIRQAEGLSIEARASSLPDLRVHGSFTRLEGDRRTPQLLLAGEQQLYADVAVTVPLLVPARWVQWLHARDNIEIARCTAAEVRRLLAIATARQYLSVVAQKRLIEVSERARTAARAHFDYAHGRHVGGVGTRLDEVRAAQEVAADDAVVEVGYAALTKLQEALGVLMCADGPIDVDADPRLPELPDLSPAALDDEVLVRTDVRASAAQKTVARRLANDSFADYLPFVIGSFLGFYSTPPTDSMPRLGWQAQLTLTVPLFDGGLRNGQARQRAALAAAADAAFAGTLRQARADVRAALDAVRRGDRALTAARQSARLTHDALDLATHAYHFGATTNIEVIEAERRTRDAETVAETAADNARQARIDLLASIGRFP